MRVRDNIHAPAKSLSEVEDVRDVSYGERVRAFSDAGPVNVENSSGQTTNGTRESLRRAWPRIRDEMDPREEEDPEARSVLRPIFGQQETQEIVPIRVGTAARVIGEY